MDNFAISATFVLALISAASCQLPCNSQLRLFPQFQHLFSHCECSYSQWSDWEPVSSSIVPTSQCPSGRALTEQRVQVDISGTSCAARSEERTVCTLDDLRKTNGELYFPLLQVNLS